MPRSEKCIERANQRSQPAAIGGVLTAKYRPLLASSDGTRKRPSDSFTEELRLMANSETGVPLTNGNKQSNVRPRKQRITDSLDGIVQSKERVTHSTFVSPKSTLFDWSDYLKDVGALPIPSDYFLHLPEDILKNAGCNAPSNLFTPPVGTIRPNQYLEGVDPHNESLFCALKVAEVIGRRLKLRFVGYPEKYDFWTSIDSHFIFPVGWCAHNNRALQPPKNFLDRDQPEFEWSTFLSEQNASAVSRQIFRIPWNCPSSGNSNHLFRIGCKLEAVDKRNPAVVCVATVKDCLCDYILVHFDGWDRGFDQWVHITSGLLHPVGYCQEEELTLSIPSEWNNRLGGFTWRQYLKENDAKTVPKEAFKQQKLVQQLQIGQRMEAVDKRCPQLIRVAHIVSFGPIGFITIGYDGWPEKVNVLLEANSIDLLPVGYCQLTGHPLHPPVGYDLDGDTNGLALDAQSNSSASSFGGFGGSGATGATNNNCTTPGCKGIGHIKGPRYSTHQRLSGCPYADVNLRKDLIRAHERLSSSNIISCFVNSASELMPVSSASIDSLKPSTLSDKVLDSHNRLSLNSNTFADLLPISIDSGSYSKPTFVVSPPVSISSTTISEPATVIGIDPFNSSISVNTGDSGTNILFAGSSITVSSNTQPLDLSVERSKCNSAPSLDVSPKQNQEFCFGNDGKDLLGAPNSHPAFATIQGNDVNSVASYMDLKQTFNLAYSQSVTMSGPTMSQAVTKKTVSSGKRPINASLKIDPGKQAVKKVKQGQRVPQISSITNDYIRQQQLFGTAGIPMKRKRGRPRKHSLNLTSSTSHRTAALTVSTTSRSSLPATPYPVVIRSQASPGNSVSLPNISGMSNAVMPTLSLYTPSNVSTAQTGTTLYTTGLVITGNPINSFTDSNINVSTENTTDPVKSDSSELSLLQQPTPKVNNLPITSYSDLVTVSTASEPVVNAASNGYDHTTSSGSLSSTSQYLSINGQSCQSTVLATTVSSFPYSSVPPGTIASNSSFNFPTAIPNDLYATVHPAAYNTFPVSSQRFANPLLPVWGVEPSVLSGGSHISSGYLNVAPTELYPSPSLYAPLHNSPSLKNSAVKFDTDLLTRLLPQANAALQAAKLVGLSGPHSWNLDVVANFVATLPGCKQFSKVFMEHEIDGAALLCLEQHDLMRVLGMKLGPAVKVFSAIQTLRRSVLATPISEFSTDQTTAMALAASCFNHTNLASPTRRHGTDEPGTVVTNGHVDASPTSSEPTDDSNRQPPCMDRFCPVSSHEFSSVI